VPEGDAVAFFYVAAVEAVQKRTGVPGVIMHGECCTATSARSTATSTTSR
jgi:hypothetical protein